MITNYIKTAIRHFLRSRVYTSINIFGLSIALASTMLIYIFIQDELSYNKFHENGDSIYSVIEQDHYYNYNYRHVPMAVGPALKQFFPEIENAVRIARLPAVVKVEDRMNNERIHFVSPAFLTMFTFPLIRGNDASALKSEDGIVLTSSSAMKYFGTADALDKTMIITIGNQVKDFVVTGIAEDIPTNSTIQWDFIIHIQNYGTFRNPEELNSWTWPRSRAYIQLKEGAAVEQIMNRFPDFVNSHFKQVMEERRSRGSWKEDGPVIEYWLQHLHDIYLKSQIISSSGGLSDIRKSLILGGIGLLILVIASINFINLSIGRASTRAMEVGVRKVMGAARKNLIAQFWIESAVTVLVSLFIGFILASLLLPLLNSMASKSLTLAQLMTVTNIPVFILGGLLLGMAAGFFPSLVLSRFQPVEIIKGKLRIGGKNRLTKSLIIIQFSLSIFLLISTFTMGKQIRFINTLDLGFDKEGIVIIKTMQRDGETNIRIVNHYKKLAESHPDILQISGTIFPFSSIEGEGTAEINGIQKHYLFSRVYYNYVETMGMRLVQGRDFSEAFSSDAEGLVVNEEFVNQFEIKNPIGFNVGGSPPSTILGVVENYNYQSVKHAVEPVIHLLDTETGPRHLLIRISTHHIGNTLKTLEETWQEVQPNKPFSYSFFDEEMSRRYRDEARWSSILTYASVLSILITCLGLVGITALMTSRRIKEIGIRKVFGATAPQITRLLVNDFLMLVIISNIITWPLAFLAMHGWLRNYAFRTEIGYFPFLLSGTLAFLIAIITIGFQTIKAAVANPVNSLRDE